MNLKKNNSIQPAKNYWSGFGVLQAGDPAYHVIMQQPKPQSTISEGGYDNDNIFNNPCIIAKYSPPTTKERRIPIPVDCPKGLESLVNLEHLFVKQSIMVTEFFRNVSNKFEIMDSFGQFIYLAAETTPPMSRIFCFGGYPFEISINSLPTGAIHSWNAKGKEILKLNGTSGSCGCGGEVTVNIGRKSVGSVEQEGDCTNPMYSVKNTMDKEILKIIGPEKAHCFACGFNTPKTGSTVVEFDIFLPDGKSRVGKIARQMYTSTMPDEENNKVVDSNNKNVKKHLWGIKFPLDLDVNSKGLLLSAAYLFEFQYYNR